MQKQTSNLITNNNEINKLTTIAPKASPTKEYAISEQLQKKYFNYKAKYLSNYKIKNIYSNLIKKLHLIRSNRINPMENQPSASQNMELNAESTSVKAEDILAMYNKLLTTHNKK